MAARFARLTIVALLAYISVLALLATTQRASARSASTDRLPLSRPASTLGACTDGLQPGGAYYRICMPSGTWNGELVLYAHGYVTYNEPLTIPENQLHLPSGTSVPDLITSLGFAFATTSYRTNGLAVRHGVDDLVELAEIFSTTRGAPAHVYVTGVSEGGLLTTLAIERRPDLFDGGLAGCGPVGDFRKQINYFGDFRVVFDYFFPGLMPGSPVSIPQSLINNWPAHFNTVIKPAIVNPANAHKVDQLFAVSGAPRDPASPASVVTSTFDALGYNVLATNDAIAKLGGQPFENLNRVYSGSDNDAQLNAAVRRFGASPAALDEIESHYQTTGQITVPLVTIHTTLDQQVPYWHEPLYRVEIILKDRIALHQHMEVVRYGHCYFQANEMLSAFAQLVSMVHNPPALVPSPRRFLPVATK